MNMDIKHMIERERYLRQSDTIKEKLTDGEWQSIVQILEFVDLITTVASRQQQQKWLDEALQTVEQNPEHTSDNALDPFKGSRNKT